MRSDDQPNPEEAVGFNFHFQIANGAGRKASAFECRRTISTMQGASFIKTGQRSN